MDLDIIRVLKSIPKKRDPEPLAPLFTPWGQDMRCDFVETCHPRPLAARSSWQPLDGWWECAFVSHKNPRVAWRSAQPPQMFDRQIRVPFSPEAALSGVGRQLTPRELLWYRRSFDLPALPAGGSCLLHFDGVDYACAVYVNGQKVAEHEGAYLPFEIDVTPALCEGRNELMLCVFDPSDTGTQLRGKQRLERGGMWYTAQSGIWQSVWLELIPRTHVEGLMLTPDLQTGEVEVSVRGMGVAMLQAELFDGDELVDSAIQSRRVDGRMTIRLAIPNHQLWTPEKPQVYDVRISYGEDELTSYVAFRTVSIEPDAHGMPRFCLNHQPYFLRGLLDQGYWPDGLLTPPSVEAMAFDIRMARTMGFNLLRKHVKVESQRFYELCDRLGILVLQDMPSGGAPPSDRWSRDIPTLVSSSWHRQRDDTSPGRVRLGANDKAYRREWRHTCKMTVQRLAGHPCVVGWVLFNESWGQFDASMATKQVHALDSTRPVLSVSGWYDQGTGEIRGVHNYFRGMHMFDDPYAAPDGHVDRAQMVSEFGGLVWPIAGHSSLEHSYGYQEFASIGEWRAALEDLLAQADALEAEGLSGYVYTQLTDVEEETNGLLTYDRRVGKLETSARSR